MALGKPTRMRAFAHARQLGPGDVFTRASSGTAIGRTGRLATAGVHAPRYAYDAQGQCRGLQMQPQSANYLTYSEIGSGWGGSAGGVTVVGDLAGIARLRANYAASQGDSPNKYFALNIASGDVMTVSAFFDLAAMAGNPRLALTLFPPGGYVSASVLMDRNTKELTTDVGGIVPGKADVLAAYAEHIHGSIWRLGVSVRANAATGGQRLDVNSSIYESIDFAGPQAERGMGMSSYIPTGSEALIRAADGLVIPAEGWIAADGYTVAIEAAVGGLSALYPYLWQLTEGTDANAIGLYLPTSRFLSVRYIQGGVSRLDMPIGGPVVKAGDRIRAAVSVVPATGAVAAAASINGALYSANMAASTGTVSIAPASLYVGAGSPGLAGTEFLGTVARLGVHARSASLSEVLEAVA